MHAYATQPPAQMFDQIEQPASQHVAVADVAGECRLGADRLGFLVGHDLSLVDAVREPPEMPAVVAKMIDEHLLREGRKPG